MPHLTVKKKTFEVPLEPGEVLIVGDKKAERLLKRFKRYLVPSVPGDDGFVPDWGPEVPHEVRARLKEKTWPLPEAERHTAKPKAGKAPDVENRFGQPKEHR